MPEGFLEECDGGRRVEVADMLRDKGFTAARDRYRCLELSPQADDARNLVRQTDRRRRKAARAAQEGGRPGDDTNHAVICARYDCPIMVGDCVGDAGEAAACIGAVDDDRFARDVGRGRDQRQIGCIGNPVDAGGAPEQFPDHQPVQRRIGQEQPDGRQSIGDAVRHPCLAARRHDDDRPLAGREQPRGDVIERRNAVSRG